jgi:D-serine deaminase-like pyridoxal phosphate-dependent protein
MTRPTSVADIPTPALVVSLAALERNIARMAAFFADGDCRLRPHFKAHKTPAIARRQLAAGSCSGITCATVAEAELAATFCDDVLLANEIVDAAKCRRVAEIARTVTMSLAVDSEVGVRAAAAAARAAGSVIGVLIDLDVGQHRCGVAPGADALRLAHLVAATRGLELRGVMGYEGHVQPVRSREERTAQARASMDALVGTAELLRRERLPCPIVSAGGSGTYDISGRVSGVTEIQAGSYALMDSDYAAVGLPFEQAFWLLGTIISRPTADRCVADCGHKAATKDHGMPIVDGVPGAVITAFNDEHAVIQVPPSSSLQIGDRVWLVPSHTDPTVNLHDVLYVVDGERVVDMWGVDGFQVPGSGFQVRF